MKFSANEDIDAPIGDVFDMLGDFDRYERSALRRGAQVKRTSDPAVTGVGMTWDVAFKLRGRAREMTLEMVTYEVPKLIRIDARSPNLASDFVLSLVALSPARTRVAVSLDLRPKNLSARLLVQSLKLAKTNLDKQFKLRVAEYSKEIEARYREAG